MATSRIDSLERPRGAGRAPGFVILMGLSLVLVTLLIGLWDWGWLPAMMVPVVAFTLWMAGNVVRVMVAEIRAGQPMGADGRKSKGEAGEGEEQ